MPRCSVERHLVRADVEAAVDGGRIAVDDLAAVAARASASASALLPDAVGPEDRHAARGVGGSHVSDTARQQHVDT